jgi:hypothetical protein
VVFCFRSAFSLVLVVESKQKIRHAQREGGKMVYAASSEFVETQSHPVMLMLPDSREREDVILVFVVPRKHRS